MLVYFNEGLSIQNARLLNNIWNFGIFKHKLKAKINLSRHKNETLFSSDIM